MELSHMWPTLVYTGMCHPRCVFLAILFCCNFQVVVVVVLSRVLTAIKRRI